MVQAQPPPDLRIPPSEHTVEVSIIDTTSFVGNIPVAAFMQPQIPGYDTVQACCYSFVIKHDNPDAPSRYDRLVFDLGVRKDWENSPATVVDQAKTLGFVVKVEKNVVDILRENGDDPEKFGGIIWSHYHWDHTGDPATFPTSTDLIVGPGFADRFVPGYPTVPDSSVHESAYKDRNLWEINFEEGDGLKLGQYRAFDFYGDGSFYLIDSPGHAIGHMCGLARTSANPTEFIIMGGDIAHHGGEFRPSQYLPLPDDVQPNPLVEPYTRNAPGCPGALFEAIHPEHSRTTSFMRPEGMVHENSEQAQESIGRWTEFDAQDNIFAMIAHDGSLFDVVDFYPKTANGWRGKGWKEQGRWRFLRDFDIKSTT